MGQTSFSGPVKSDKGFIENSFTTAERDALPTPVVGTLIYNTDTNSYDVFGNSGWQPAFGNNNTGPNYFIDVDYAGASTFLSQQTPTDPLLVCNLPALNPNLSDHLLALATGESFNIKVADNMGDVYTYVVVSNYVSDNGVQIAVHLNPVTSSFPPQTYAFPVEIVVPVV